MANLHTVKKELFLSDDESSDSSITTTPPNTRSGYSSNNTSLFARRSRVSFDKEITDLLIKTFDKCQYPDFTERSALAEKAGVSEARIQVWFQNRRTRMRRKNHVINKPSNLPGPRVRMTDGSDSLASPITIKPAPLACIVQPQPRKLPRDEKSTFEVKPVLHSVDNILNAEQKSNDVGKKRKRKIETEESLDQDEPLDLSINNAKRQHMNVMNTSTPTLGAFPWLPIRPLFPFMNSPFISSFPIMPISNATINAGMCLSPGNIIQTQPQDSGYNSNGNDSF